MRAVDLVERAVARALMSDAPLFPPIETVNGSPSTRDTACTPGTFNRLGTCSVS